MCVCVCVYIYVCVCVYIYICVCVYIYIFEVLSNESRCSGRPHLNTESEWGAHVTPAIFSSLQLGFSCLLCWTLLFPTRSSESLP